MLTSSRFLIRDPPASESHFDYPPPYPKGVRPNLTLH